jgi:serine/threonine-protein kinase
VDDVIGREIEGYIVEDLLDDGGTGVVYRGKKPRGLKTVIIKLGPRAQAENEQMLERYMREMRLMDEISHPNILPIMNWGITEDERPYIIREFIEGQTLHGRLKAAPMTPQEAWAVLQPLSDVLSYLHKQDILHRNIKPKKILLADDGHLYLNDFGFGKQLGVDHTVGINPGTISPVQDPEYMAPEFVTHSNSVDPRSDLYSLGITLYEMLLGRVPFPGGRSAMQIVMEQAGTPPPEPRQLNPDFPLALQFVLLKALEKQQADRYQSAEEMAKAYKNALRMLPEGHAERDYWVA